MRDLEAIASSFLQVDNSLEDLRDRHHAAGEAEERDRVARQQRLNEQAHFVLAWGQLEAEDEWRRTMELYDVRNQIAHGDLRSEGIDVSTVIKDFYRIQSSLARD